MDNLFTGDILDEETQRGRHSIQHLMNNDDSLLMWTAPYLQVSTYRMEFSTIPLVVGRLAVQSKCW